MGAVRPQRRFTVDEFHRMGEAGILGPDDRVELLDGRILEMPAIGSRHAGCVNRLNRLFTRELGDRAVVTVQNPVFLDAHNELVPDLTLSRPRDDFYSSAHPRPEDVLLLVEVADTTLPFDRRVKVPAYARHGIPEVWVVNLPDRRLEVYAGPGEDGYRDSRILSEEESVRVRAVSGLCLEVEQILG